MNKKIVKKVLSLLIAAIMLMGIIPFNDLSMFFVTAESELTEGDYTYEVLDDCAMIINVKKSITGNITVPSTLGGYPVTSILFIAFADCNFLTSVTLPDTVTDIGNQAFYDCKSLTSITISESVTTIQDYAFAFCSALTDIIIPNSVISIGNCVFDGCSSLKNIDVADGNPMYSSADGVLFNKDKTVLIKYPEGSTKTDYTIPDSVTSIGDSAFVQSNHLKNITIPNSVTHIGDFALCSCENLTKIYIPNSVTDIGQQAFIYCFALKGIEVDNDNPMYSSADGVLFNKDKTRIIQYPPADTRTSYTIPDSVTSIGISAFENCGYLTNITIPDSVTSIGGRAFLGTAYYQNMSVRENGVSYIGKYLMDINREEISSDFTVKNGTQIIADNAFEYCEKLESITIPDSVTSIGDCAFCYCENLTNITIPNSVTDIGKQAFIYCYALKSIEVDNENPKYSSVDGVLFSKDKTLLIQCPAGNTRTSYNIPDSVTSIGDCAFFCCESLISITIPNGVTSIGHEAFYSCYSLTASITIPESVTSIGDMAFSGCSSLTGITIPNTVTSIGKWTFSGCGNLKVITVPDSVTEIGERAFNHCASLTDISIPNTVTSIGSGAFEECNQLANVYFGGTEADWNKITIGVRNHVLSKAAIHFQEEQTPDKPSGNASPGAETGEQSGKQSEKSSKSKTIFGFAAGRTILFVFVGLVVLAGLIALVVVLIKKSGQQKKKNGNDINDNFTEK